MKAGHFERVATLWVTDAISQSERADDTHLWTSLSILRQLRIIGFLSSVNKLRGFIEHFARNQGVHVFKMMQRIISDCWPFFFSETMGEKMPFSQGHQSFFIFLFDKISHYVYFWWHCNTSCLFTDLPEVGQWVGRAVVVLGTRSL